MYAKSGKKYLNVSDIATEAIAVINTDKVVAFFQNKATKKIIKIPGVNKPVNSCIY